MFPLVLEQVETILGTGRAGANTLYNAPETNDGGIMELEVFPRGRSVITPKWVDKQI